MIRRIIKANTATSPALFGLSLLWERLLRGGGEGGVQRIKGLPLGFFASPSWEMPSERSGKRSRPGPAGLQRNLPGRAGLAGRSRRCPGAGCDRRCRALGRGNWETGAALGARPRACPQPAAELWAPAGLGAPGQRFSLWENSVKEPKKGGEVGKKAVHLFIFPPPQARSPFYSPPPPPS